MAKIKGIELKNLKDFRGHEGESLMQGDVYYKGKRIGYYSQDAWGGMDIFDIDWKLPKELRQEVKNITDNYIGGKLFEKIDQLYEKTYNCDFHYDKKGYEYLFMDLLELQDQEKLYKKYSKKWNINNIYIVYDTLFDRHICVKLTDTDKTKTYFSYNSLNDFIID